MVGTVLVQHVEAVNLGLHLFLDDLVLTIHILIILVKSLILGHQFILRESHLLAGGVVLIDEHDILLRGLRHEHGYILALLPVALANERQVVYDVELEADRNDREQHHTEPLSQFGQTAIFELLAVEEDDECRDHDAHILEEGLLVRHLNHVAEAAAILHHAEVIFPRELQMLCDGEPHCQEEEKGHEEEESPSGPLHFDTEDQHAA